MRRLTSLAPLLLASCTVPGPVDTDAALEVVYDEQGTPAFAGQALVIQSCGGGGTCHREESDALDPQGRFGAPQGLTFDLTLASTNSDVDSEPVQRLCRSQESILGHAALVWQQVSAGAMPPPPPDGAQETAVAFFRYAADGTTVTELPALDTDEGRDIFRNWLAAGAPLVERTEGRQIFECDSGGFPGWVVPRCERQCVDATFASIYRRVLRPTCAASRCHDASDPAAGLDLQIDPTIAQIEDPAAREAALAAAAGAAWSRLVEDGSLSDAEQCATEGLPLVDTDGDDPMRSILFRKLTLASDDPGQCGSRMPLSGAPLSDQRICAIRTWIECGACGPDDASCDACVDAARAGCGIDPSAESLCAGAMPCPNRAP